MTATAPVTATTIVRTTPRTGQRSRPTDPYVFESIGDIMRRLRREAERQMTGTFDRALSLRLDQLLVQEERAAVSNLRR